jgi:hypothetical protein
MFATECEIKPAFIFGGGGWGGWGDRMLEPYVAAYIATVLQLPYAECVPKIQPKAEAKYLKVWNMVHLRNRNTKCHVYILVFHNVKTPGRVKTQ